jgi:hypothetical protein
MLVGFLRRTWWDFGLGLWIATVAPATAPAEDPVSFVLDVQPVLTKQGCNQGACHGAQHGKGGFKLSLRGFDDAADYFEIVKSAQGRRVTPSDPTMSILLTKPLLRVPHKGGRRLSTDSWAFDVLLRWIEQGAPGPRPNERRVKSLVVAPSESLCAPEDELVVEATAIYDDGSRERVSHKATFDSSQPSVAQVDADGLVVARGRGESAIVVRYLGHVAVSRVMIPYGPPVNLAGFAMHNFIDELWVAKWHKLGLAPTKDCTDAEFFRRIHLDTLGTLPGPEEIRRFLADRDSQKRNRAIDAVLNRPEYVEYWAYKWGDLLRNNRNELQEKGMWSLHNWLRASFRDNKPIDRFTMELVSAVGSPYQHGPANFYRVGRNPQEWAENTAQVFLGVRIQCAQCHHHPFESISQRDYFSMAAFFARLGTKNSQEFGLFGRDSVIYVRDSGDVRHPRTGELMKPTPLGGQPIEDPVDRRSALAGWLADKRNLGLARNIANRYWGYYLGRGLIHPVDDIRSSNPASCPELLDALARDLIAHNYDIKHLLRTIMRSHVYQLSAQPYSENTPDPDNKYFTRYTSKRLTAEQLLDAVDFACGTQEKYNQLPLGYRAIALPDTNVASRFLDVFGRPRREITCECERADTPNMSQALQLMTGNLLNRKVADANGRIARRIKEKVDPAAIIEELYLCSVSRPPTQTEANRCLELVRGASSPREGLEDLLWAMLNTREFQFCH